MSEATPVHQVKHQSLQPDCMSANSSNLGMSQHDWQLSRFSGFTMIEKRQIAAQDLLKQEQQCRLGLLKSLGRYTTAGLHHEIVEKLTNLSLTQ